MPRLFTSARPPPANAHTTMHTPSLATVPAPAQSKRKLPDLRDDEDDDQDLELIDDLGHQLFAATSASEPQSQAALDGVVKVPSLPKNLTRLMDSHDLDNPYLVASLNVLIGNDNNPMRVPDILHAVQKQGWTQVLHRHKDRPEQLFGNALRAHQRRREFMNRPSLVFMVDAGGCWKHNELDLSAASGRRKGKIWCLSLESGYPCPYARLGLDLKWVMQAQHGPGGPSASTSQKADSEEPSAKKRKINEPPRNNIPPKAALTRPQQLKGTGEVATLKSPQILLQPPKVYHPSSVLTRTTPRVAVSPVVVTAIPPSTPVSKQTSYGTRASARQPPPVAIPSVDPLTLLPKTPSPLAQLASTAVKNQPEPVKAAEQPFDEVMASGYNSESDDDDNDFHVTMTDYSISAALGVSPFKARDDRDMDCELSSDESMARTPSPPLAPSTDLAGAVELTEYDAREMGFLGGEAAVHDVMVDDPAWSWLTQAGEKNLDSLAAARVTDYGMFEDEFPPFEEFLDRRVANISMAVSVPHGAPVVKSEDLEVDMSSPYSNFDFDAASLFESHRTSSSASSSFIGRVTRESSVCSNISRCSSRNSMALSTSSSFSPAPMSTLHSNTTTTVPLFIATHSLTDDSLIVAESQSLPLKNGLAHQYVTVSTPSADESAEFFGGGVLFGDRISGPASEEIKELEELLDWDAADASLSTTPPKPQSMEVSLSGPVETLIASTAGSAAPSFGASACFSICVTPPAEAS